MVNTDKIVFSLDDQAPIKDEATEMLERSRERINKLRALSYKLGNNINELEKQPAYERKNVKLDNVPHSSENNLSRLTVSEDEEKKTELKQNNSFLHDNVD